LASSDVVAADEVVEDELDEDVELVEELTEVMVSPSVP
jgi:hypothetical protein